MSPQYPDWTVNVMSEQIPYEEAELDDLVVLDRTENSPEVRITIARPENGERAEKHINSDNWTKYKYEAVSELKRGSEVKIVIPKRGNGESETESAAYNVQSDHTSVVAVIQEDEIIVQEFVA